MHIEGVDARHLAEGEADDLFVGIEDAALQPQSLIRGEGADQRVVLVADAAVKAVAVLLVPHHHHVEAAGDQFARQRDEAPVMLRLKAVAVILLPVHGFARIGGELFGAVDIVEVLCLRLKAEAAGELGLQLLAVLPGDAADDERIAAAVGELPQRLDSRAQRPAADGEDEGRAPLVAQLGQHPVAEAADQLTVVSVPDEDVAEVVVGGAAVLGADDLVHPWLVTQRDIFEGDHKVLNRSGCRSPGSPFSRLADP